MERRPDILNDPARQESFYDSSKAWIEALAERNGLVGRLTVMPNDPVRYPYQRLDAGLVKSYRPSAEDIEGFSEQEAGDRVVEILRYGASEIIGEDNYKNFVRDLRDQALSPVPGGASKTEGTIFVPEAGSALKFFRARTKTRNHHSSLVGYHPNILALPIYAAVLIDAVKQTEEASGNPFNTFDLTEQIILPISASLGFAEYDGVPVVKRLAALANISLIVPSTASTRLYGIDSELRKAINAQADEKFESHLESLDKKGKSAILISDPTGSTAERVNDESGSLNGLRFRKVPPGAHEQLSRFNFAWPVTMWWANDPKSANWFVGSPVLLGGSSGSSKLVHELATETGKLAGVNVYFGRDQNPLGGLAVAAA